MTKGKILQPILFALALVMVFSAFGVTPAYAGCRHSYNSDSVYIRSDNEVSTPMRGHNSYGGGI